MRTKLYIVLGLMLVMLLAACGPTERSVDQGATRETYAFEEAGTFETGEYESVSLSIADGIYAIGVSGAGIIWGQAEDGVTGSVHTDVIVEVEGRISEGADEAIYGVMCRADQSNNGDGYLFAVSKNGNYVIYKGQGTEYKVLSQGGIPGGASFDGEAMTTLRGVCVENYLAMYINGVFITAVEDGDYSQGVVGLAAGANVDGAGGDAVAVFDNLAVYDASLAAEE